MLFFLCKMIFTCLRKFHLAIEETPLTADTQSCLRYPWVGWAYNPTYKSFSLGVSVLVHGLLDYQDYDVKIDADGRFIFCIAILVPFKMCASKHIHSPTETFLRILLSFLAGKPELPPLIVRDFNSWINPLFDKHPVLQASASLRGTPMMW